MATKQPRAKNADGRGPMFNTRNDLPETVRAEMVVLLNQQLADITDLYSQTKQAHWNVKGPEFFQLHELFDDLAEVVEGYIDEVAERITALGGATKGTVRMAASNSRLPEYPMELSQGLQHVEALAERYAQFAAGVREDIDTADEAGDTGTTDLLTEIIRAIDKQLWFLDAHLQSA